MYISLPVLLISFLSHVTAQVGTSLYTDPKTKITFSAFSDPTTGYTFGLALNSTPSADFIGLLVGKGTGWSGVSLGGSMVNKLLVATWPNSKAVLGTFRKATTYAPPPEITTTAFTRSAIANGTFVNATHYQYIFYCKACIATDGTTFNKADTTAVLGWAFSTAAPTTPSKSSSALVQHAQQGTYEVDLTKARSDLFYTWAKGAK